MQGIATMSCAAVAMLLAWAPSSIGSAGDNPVLAKLSAVPSQAAAKEAPVDSRHESSERPTRPTCAELAGAASTQTIERTGESNLAVGCGVRGNVAGGTQAGDQIEERIDVATFHAWHSQARYFQYASDAAPLRTLLRTSELKAGDRNELTMPQQELLPI